MQAINSIVSKETKNLILKLSFKHIFFISLIVLVICYPQVCLSKIRIGSSTHNGSEEKEDTSSASTEDEGEIEMTEYLDDEVKFVTEDDFLYEDERSHYRDSYQGSISGSSRLSQYERCPPLPDPSIVASSGLCEAKKCQRDDECSRDGSVVCCYNGCIYSCLPKVNPPLAFDWVEETDLTHFSTDTVLSDVRFGPSPKALMDAQIGPELLTLPGGCYLSRTQYDDLILFRRFDHVKACSCSKGEVSCEINQELPNKND